MISTGNGFVMRHASGRFLWIGWAPPNKQPGGVLLSCSIYALIDSPFEASAAHSKDFRWNFFSHERGWTEVESLFEIVSRPVCGCCGELTGRMHLEGGICRCARHLDRNPCAIEGCKRTGPARLGLADDQRFCSVHWKIACPPRSALRRCYHRFHRIARKTGWTPELKVRFWRFWDALVKRARRGGEGHLDIAEIDRLFGWAA